MPGRASRLGKANQVSFDPGKESKHILSVADPDGPSFKLLGITYEMELIMADAVDEVLCSVMWKLRTLLRTRRFYSTADMLVLYKSHVIPFVEYRTAAIYHARRDVLVRLDRVQDKFLEDVGISSQDSWLHFNLAPLAPRRDMAMLGLIHRAVLKKGPEHFQQFFRVTDTGGIGRHRFTLLDKPTAQGGPSNLRTRSALGLIPVYNLLPGKAVEQQSVSAFQASLQRLLEDRASGGAPEWAQLFSPRTPLAKHPLQ